MKFTLTKALTVGAIAAAIVTMAHAQQNRSGGQNQGKDDYDSHCAACHGASGAGDGPRAGLLNVTVPNLTTLSKRNGGVFPYSQVYETIAGTLALPAHGTRKMPIWGEEFRYKAGPRNRSPELFVRSKIIALVVYVHGLQAK
jgi:mono/diheme cytochrome c family protein